MAQPYIGEIRMFAGTYEPNGWYFCDGRPLPISQNETLFQLIGTTYGGDGQETFNLPNLQSRIPIHMTTDGTTPTYSLAEMAGTEQETLTMQQIPFHTHPALASSQGASERNPANAVPGQALSQIYIDDTAATNLSAQAISPIGGSQPHNNLQPSLCINFIISLFGIFPSPT